MSKPIEFYFDFSSPYAYLAAAEIDALAAKHHRNVVWKPMMLGIALKMTGNKPLVDVPMKGEYMRRDIPRTAKRLKLPFVWPEKFPYAAIAASRVFYWLSARDETKAKLFARAIFTAYFGHGKNVDTPEAVAEVASHLGVPKEETLAALQDQAVKDRLKAETDAAIAKGVFGSPFFIVDGEPYWGQDRLADVARQLGGMSDIAAVAHAFDFVARKHVSQRRKGTSEEPYINHLIEVAHLLAEATNGADTVLVMAGALHDVIEDTDVTAEELAASFGAEIAALVLEVTDDEALSYAERKRRQVETAPHISTRAKLIKLADKTSNLRSLVASPPKLWDGARRREYARWSREVAVHCMGINDALDRAFEEAYRAAARQSGLEAA